MATGSRARGFTVIELMIVITIMAVLASFAIPAFGDLMNNNRRTLIVNELLSNLMLARAEAAKRGQPLVVCGINDANANKVLETSEQTCADSDWRDGWMLAYWDDAPPVGNGDGAVDDDELALPPVKVYINDYPDIRITATKPDTTPATADDDPALTTPVIMAPFSGRSTASRMTICDKRGIEKSRAVEVFVNGRARSAVNKLEDTTASGVVLTCP